MDAMTKDSRDERLQELLAQCLESASMDVGAMHRGVYVVKVETSHGLVTERIVKR